MSEASRRAAIEIADKFWAVPQGTHYRVMATDFLVDAIDTAIARAVEGERKRVIEIALGWVPREVIEAALRAPGEKA